jgi:RNA polymerase sigma-70 factor (ECF subfamily)
VLRRYQERGDRADPPPDPERAARAREATERIHRALQRVDPVFREVVVLFDLQGHSYQEIAAICGIPIGTVKSRLGRGREALRRAVLEEREEAP